MIFLQPFKRYAEFTGRSTRTEYWSWTAFVFVVTMVLETLIFAGRDPSNMNSLGPLGMVGLVIVLAFTLGIFIPSLAVTIRRLHDSNRSGWWWLIVLIPFIGALVLLIFMLLPGTAGDNQFGPDPRTASAVAA